MPDPTPAPAAAPANAAPSNAAPAADPSKQAPETPAPAAPQPAAASAEPGAKPQEAPKDQPKSTTPVVAADLKLPEGSLLDPKTVDEIVSFSKEKGLSKEAAQAVLERESARLSSYVEGEKAKLTQVQNSWTEASRTDKEIGGDKFAENVECANRVFKHFGNENFMKLLDATKAGNNPDVLRVFNRIGRALGIMDDKFVVPDGQASGQSKDAATTLYGKTS